jgi:hypothetical protein
MLAGQGAADQDALDRLSQMQPGAGDRRVQGQTRVQLPDGTAVAARELTPRPGTVWLSPAASADEALGLTEQDEAVGVSKAAGWREWRVAAAWAVGQAEPWLLVTSLTTGAQRLRTHAERWEIETTLDEVKVHQWAHPRPLRSKRPREVVQEIYGLLLAHLAIRTLLHRAALREGLDPDRLSFTGALRVLRRAIPRAQRPRPARLPFVCRPAERGGRRAPAAPPPAPEPPRSPAQAEQLQAQAPTGPPLTAPAPPTVRILWP